LAFGRSLARLIERFPQSPSGVFARFGDKRRSLRSSLRGGYRLAHEPSAPRKAFSFKRARRQTWTVKGSKETVPVLSERKRPTFTGGLSPFPKKGSALLDAKERRFCLSACEDPDYFFGLYPNEQTGWVVPKKLWVATEHRLRFDASNEIIHRGERLIGLKNGHIFNETEIPTRSPSPNGLLRKDVSKWLNFSFSHQNFQLLSASIMASSRKKQRKRVELSRERIGGIA
jgi:hypothetical protein